MTFNKLLPLTLASFCLFSFMSTAHAACHGSMQNLSKTTVTLRMAPTIGDLFLYTGMNYCNVRSTADGAMVCTFTPGAKISYLLLPAMGKTHIYVWIGLGTKPNITYSPIVNTIDNDHNPTTCFGMTFKGYNPLCVIASDGTKACISFVGNGKYNITTSGTGAKKK